MKKISEFFKRIKKWRDSHKTLFAAIIALLFVAIHIPLILTHEVWDDEAIVWSISKDINLSNIYEVNEAEPHPILWQLLLAPLSQSGFPFLSMNILSLIIVSLAVFLLVRFAPLGAVSKSIFILSSAFLYFNPIIARDYALAPLAICLVCMAYKTRHEKPFRYGLTLAFLSQTHFLMYGLLAILGIGFFIEELIEKKKISNKVGSLIKCFSVVTVSVLIVLPIVVSSFEKQAIMSGLGVDGEYGYGTLAQSSIAKYYGFYVSALGFVMPITLALIAIGFVASNIKIGLYYIFSTGFWFFVMSVFYKNYYILNQKVSLLTLFVLFAMWLIMIESNKNKNIVRKTLELSEIVKLLSMKVKNASFIIPLIVVAFTIPRAITYALDDIYLPYTSAKETADIINEKIEDDAIIIEGDAIAANNFGMSTYIQISKNVTFYNIPLNMKDDYKAKQRYGTDDQKKYDEFSYLDDDELARLLDEVSKEYEHVYYVSSLVRTCKGAETDRNIEVIGKYESIALLNQGEYLDNYNPTLKIYKIK